MLLFQVPLQLEVTLTHSLGLVCTRMCADLAEVFWARARYELKYSGIFEYSQHTCSCSDLA